MAVALLATHHTLQCLQHLGLLHHQMAAPVKLRQLPGVLPWAPGTIQGSLPAVGQQ